ncbi:MAG: glutamate formimidoyltransferase [bacterium]|nr:glutamate formimidoyltransferase [bacterium]
MRLVECVPNFSEGRRAEVIDAVRAAIVSVDGVYLLDVSSDADHNRMVITFAGEPEIVGEAAFRAVEAAATLIDLEAHNGVHPRIGAADVVPFIPLRGVTMAECVALARRVGERIGRELALPVYLYEQAALHPERRNLAVVRRDPYEVLRTTIQTDTSRLPDFGPALLGKAGAVAVGAREPLIAFNAYLNTSDVQVAVEIARAVRESGGGLPYLKALGLLVNGMAQVSMNVIDFRKTSLFTILEAVKGEAARHGVIVAHTELVGLIPQSALIDAALSYLQLPPQTRDLILEKRLGEQTGDYHEVLFE